MLFRSLGKDKNFRFIEADLADTAAVEKAFLDNGVTHCVHLAAQAGVRYSLINPHAYGSSNLTGFLNILEACRHHKIEHLVYASSSSVYGANTSMPFSIHDNVDHPLSLYAATKKANELMAHSYAHMFGLPSTGLRFFTVYGPWGRPDMAPQKFTARIFAGHAIDVYNEGKMMRDFTFIDDIVEGVVRVTDHIPVPDESWNAEAPTPDASGVAPFRIFNIGRGAPVDLMDFIAAIENALGKKAIRNYLPMQKGDVPRTFANTDLLERLTGYRPHTSIEEGVGALVDWYREYRTMHGGLEY